jgi:protein phosphatase
MGTTVVVVLVDGDTAYYSSVGDSRLYLWRGGRLTQLTRDDSWVSETFGQGADTPPGDAAMHPMRHVLTKVVGLRTDLELTVAAHLLASGDGLLLCSDGVHGSISDERLAEVMGSGRPVAEIAAAVVEAALDGGATDNITAVVARYD